MTTLPANLTVTEVERLIQEARDAGYTAGYRDGLQDGACALPVPIVEAVEAIVEAMDTSKDTTAKRSILFARCYNMVYGDDK